MRFESGLGPEWRLVPGSRLDARALAGETHACPKAHRAGTARLAVSGAAARPAATIGDGLATRDRIRHERFTVQADRHDSAALYTQAAHASEDAVGRPQGAS